MTILRTVFYGLVFASTSVVLFGQQVSPTDSIHSNRSFYHTYGIGLGFSSFRDLATSPLFYDGFGLQLFTAWTKFSDHHDQYIDFDLSFSPHKDRPPNSDFLQPSTGAFLGQFNLRVLELWKIKPFSSPKVNVKFGGAVLFTQNFRVNTALQNAALGLESFAHIMAAGQVSVDVSRKKARSLKFLFIKRELPPVRRELRFLFQGGLLNLNQRPGYAYVYHNEIDGTGTNPIEFLRGPYRLNVGGWRFSTECTFITFRPAGNALGISYLWDASYAPGVLESFQMSSHRLRFSYHFKTKKK
jgi:hypothetical protein